MAGAGIDSKRASARHAGGGGARRRRAADDLQCGVMPLCRPLPLRERVSTPQVWADAPYGWTVRTL
eukprot:356347-Chlamydomonas_euryale.AAC.5